MSNLASGVFSSPDFKSIAQAAIGRLAESQADVQPTVQQSPIRRGLAQVIKQTVPTVLAQSQVPQAVNVEATTATPVVQQSTTPSTAPTGLANGGTTIASLSDPNFYTDKSALTRYHEGAKDNTVSINGASDGTAYGKYQWSALGGGMEGLVRAGLQSSDPNVQKAFQTLVDTQRAHGGTWDLRGLSDADKAAVTKAWQDASADPNFVKFQDTHHDNAYFKKVLDNLPEGLKEMVLSDKSNILANIVDSTANALGAGGAIKSFRKIYRDGMSARDLAEASFNDRPTHYTRFQQQTTTDNFNAFVNRINSMKNSVLAALDAYGRG